LGSDVGCEAGLELAELVLVAWRAARRWPGLAPLGGTHWGAHDLEQAVSLLLVVKDRPAFGRAFPGEWRGSEAARAYLLEALHRELLKDLARRRRHPSLDALGPTTECARPDDPRGLGAADALHYARELLRRLTEQETAEVARALRGAGPVAGDAPGAPGTSVPAPSTRTRGRLRASVRDKGRRFAAGHDLKSPELADVLRSVAVVLAGRPPP
jgi:DNA-directed RNA polymerase specialized sigma24 family protein